MKADREGTDHHTHQLRSSMTTMAGALETLDVVGSCKAADTVSLSVAELLIGGSTAGRVGGRPGEINNNKWFFWNLFSSSLRVFTIQVCGSGQD